MSITQFNALVWFMRMRAITPKICLCRVEGAIGEYGRKMLIRREVGLEMSGRSPIHRQVRLLQSRIKNDFIIQVLIVLSKYPQMGISIIATAEAGNNPVPHIRQKVDNTPRVQRVKVRHILTSKTLKPLYKAGGGPKQVKLVLTFRTLGGLVLGRGGAERRSQLFWNLLKMF
jgi:hypothetical protein